MSMSSADPALDIDALYNQHARFLTRVLIRLVGDLPAADDLLQETFLIAYRKRASFDCRGAPRAWLYGIATNLAMRHRRGAGRLLRALGLYGQEPTQSPSGPDEDLEKADAANIVRRALEALPFKQREVFVLYELEELDGGTIADLIGIPINTVWTRLHHGRKRFEDLVRKHARREGT
jgi:RNA polymerase sigma-70 factor (ECF subfamily)